MLVDPAQSLQRKSLQFGAAVVAILGACAGTGLFAAYSLSGALRHANAANDAILNHLTADMMHDALRSDVALALLASDPSLGMSISEIEADAREHARELRDRISRNEASLTGDAARVVASVAGPLEEYVRTASELIALSKRDPIAARAGLKEFQVSFVTLETAMENASEAIRSQSESQSSTANAQSGVFQALTLLLALAGIGVCVLLVVVARRRLVAPLVEFSECLVKLSAGDTEAAVDVGPRRDEIGAMVDALEGFRQNQRERRRLEAQQREDAARAERDRIAAVEEAERIVVESIGSGLAKLARGDLVYRMSGALPPAYARLKTDFNAAMEQLQGVLKSILSNASGIGSGTREISHASDNLSRRTEQQAASLEQTAAALDQITATISRTADGARTASGIIVTARSEAEKSGAIVNSAVQAMSAIEKSAAQISQIIGVIDEIAFQTNLLALNAGVEAARAGEAGRGFAVVAQEVRALAQRSAEAAKEIKGLISASSSQVSEGVKLVDETGEALHRIVRRVIEIDSVVTEIAASATEQSTALHQVNSAVNQMDQATQQNAAMVEQTTAATHSLDRETEALVGLIQKFEIGANAATSRSAPPVRTVTPRRAVATVSVSSARKGSLAVAAAPESDNWEEF